MRRFATSRTRRGLCRGLWLGCGPRPDRDRPAELLGRALLVRPDGAHEGGFGAHPELERTVAAKSGAFLDAGRTGTLEIGEQGSRCGAPLTVLVESSVPPPRMIVFGAIDFASALVRVGKFLGYHV